MSRFRAPICYWFAILSVLTYMTCSIVAYLHYSLPFSLANNWLSDLGNQVSNPRGASLYNAGVILTALFIAAWFAGLSQWRLPNHTANRRLLVISQAIGILSSTALVLSALNPINMPVAHAFWSQLHFLGSGIAFAFSVTALRYHRSASVHVLCLGICASLMPFLMFTFGRGIAFWMEWVAVALFILYVLSVGRASLKLAS